MSLILRNLLIKTKGCLFIIPRVQSNIRCISNVLTSHKIHVVNIKPTNVEQNFIRLKYNKSTKKGGKEQDEVNIIKFLFIKYHKK